MSQMGNAQMQRAGAVTDEYFILISNIPFRSRWQDLKDLVRTVTPHVEHAEIYLMNNGRSRGHGYVKIKGREEAEKVCDFLSNYVWEGRALVVTVGNANASVPVAVPEALSGPQSQEAPVVAIRRPDPLFAHHSIQTPPQYAYVVPLQPEYLDDRLLVSSMPGASAADLARARYEVCLQAYSHYMAEAHNVGTRMRLQAAAAEQQRQSGSLQQATESARRVELLVESQKHLEAQAVTARTQMLLAYQTYDDIGREGSVPTPYMTSPLVPYALPPATGPGIMSIPVATTSALTELPMIIPQPQPFAVTYSQPGPLYVSAPNGTPINLTHGAVQTEARGIFIGGLPYEAEWQELKDRLKAAGNVIRCEVPKRANDGRGKGYATALFSTHQEAKAAVEMFHDTEFKGRTIRVKLDAQRTTMRPPTAGSTSSSEEAKAEEIPRQPIIVDGSSSSRTISACHSPKMVTTNCW